jgi:hypothetical protein
MEKTQPGQKIMAIRKGCVTNAKRRPSGAPFWKKEALFEKSAQKLFGLWAVPVKPARPKGIKVFLLLFVHKK